MDCFVLITTTIMPANNVNKNAINRYTFISESAKFGLVVTGEKG